HGARADIAQFFLDAAPVLTEFQDAAEIFVGREDGGLDPRLVDFGDLYNVRHVGRVVQEDGRAVRHVDLVDHRRGGGDEVEVELAAEALLDDFEVEQAKEATAEAEAEGGAGFHLPGEAGVVEAQLAHRSAQVFELGGVDREEAAEHDRLDFAEAG